MCVSHILDYPLLTAQNMHKLGGKKPTNNTPTIPKAQMAMTGFLLPLVKLATAYADHTHTRLQVLSLTPLGYGLHLNASVPDVAVPQFNDMITRPQAKRDLWQLLHS